MTCYNCNQVGHSKRNCPEEKGKFSGDIPIFATRVFLPSENYSGTCIFPSFILVKSDKKMDLECYHCKETGHLSRDCTKEGGIACYNCGSKGHLSRNCTQR